MEKAKSGKSVVKPSACPVHNWQENWNGNIWRGDAELGTPVWPVLLVMGMSEKKT